MAAPLESDDGIPTITIAYKDLFPNTNSSANLDTPTGTSRLLS